MQQDPLIIPTMVEAPPAIEFRSVSKTYMLETGDQVVAVNDVSLIVPRGQFLCVMGPSGQGKSTLLNLVAGFIKPSTGQVLVNDQLVRGPGPDRGVVFQRDTVFGWMRVAENIGFGLKARGVRKAARQVIVQRYLKIVDLESFARAWPRQLSGGMRRRVAIATVFANEPDVLLTDEPFVGLDYVRRATLHKVLLDLWQDSGRTVFFVTHDVDEALALADRVVVMVAGRVVLDIPVPISRPRSAEMIGGVEASILRVQLLTAIGATLADQA